MKCSGMAAGFGGREEGTVATLTDCKNMGEGAFTSALAVSNNGNSTPVEGLVNVVVAYVNGEGKRFVPGAWDGKVANHVANPVKMAPVVGGGGRGEEEAEGVR